MLIYFNKRLYKFPLLTHHCKEAFPGPPGLRAYWAPDAKEIIIVTAANLSMDAVVHNGVERKTVKPFTSKGSNVRILTPSSLLCWYTLILADESIKEYAHQ